MHMFLELLPHHINNKGSVMLLMTNIFSSSKALAIKSDGIVGNFRRQRGLKRRHRSGTLFKSITEFAGREKLKMQKVYLEFFFTLIILEEVNFDP